MLVSEHSNREDQNKMEEMNDSNKQIQEENAEEQELSLKKENSQSKEEEQNQIEEQDEKSSEEKEKERISDSLQRIKLLPLEKTPESAAKRSQLFDRFDPNGILFLSISEIDKGVREILSFSERFLKKDIIKKAFISAKKSGAKRNNSSEELIEKNEFRSFLVFLRQYSEYYEIFELMNSTEDRKITYEEFKTALPIMKNWGVEVDDSKAAFEAIETNDGETVLFDEYCFWAINKNLEMEKDENFDDEELAKLASDTNE